MRWIRPVFSQLTSHYKTETWIIWTSLALTCTTSKSGESFHLHFEMNSPQANLKNPFICTLKWTYSVLLTFDASYISWRNWLCCLSFSCSNLHISARTQAICWSSKSGENLSCTLRWTHIWHIWLRKKPKVLNDLSCSRSCFKTEPPYG